MGTANTIAGSHSEKKSCYIFQEEAFPQFKSFFSNSDILEFKINKEQLVQSVITIFLLVNTLVKSLYLRNFVSKIYQWVTDICIKV